MVIFGADSVVIGAILGPAAVPAYALALKGTRSMTLGLHKVADALFPAYAALKAIGDVDGTRRWYTISARVEVAGSVVLALTLWPAGRTVLGWWLGQSNVLVLPAFMLAVLLIILEAIIHPAAVLAAAAGGERPLAGANNVEAAANLGLSLALIRPWGVTGVIAGTVVAQIFTNLWWLPRWAIKYLGWSWHDYATRTIVPSLVPGAVGTLAAAGFWLVFRQVSPSAAGLASGVAGGFAFLLTYSIPFRERPEVRRAILLAAHVGSQLRRPRPEPSAPPPPHDE
jgi:O-antigen/teichoic acid export membrane protein